MHRNLQVAFRFCPLFLAGLLLAAAARAAEPPLPKVVEFNRDVRPILADNCFACHGPDKNQRKADLRLDTEEGPFGDQGGTKVLVPGQPGQSELFLRITSDGTTRKRMPP